MMPYDGFRRGGAPIALAPEIILPQPGPDAFLDYSKNDEWAVGMIGHELLSSMGAVPFADMEHPKTYTDAGYQDESIPERCRPLIAALLRLAVAERLDAVEGSRRAKRLEGELPEDGAVELDRSMPASAAVDQAITELDGSGQLPYQLEATRQMLRGMGESTSAVDAEIVKAKARVEKLIAELKGSGQMPDQLQATKNMLMEMGQSTSDVEAEIAKAKARLARLRPEPAPAPAPAPGPARAPAPAAAADPAAVSVAALAEKLTGLGMAGAEGLAQRIAGAGNYKKTKKKGRLTTKVQDQLRELAVLHIYMRLR